ncbi:MAG: substrate-binding domain-containing protein [Alphaproteobacteria bacterium]
MTKGLAACPLAACLLALCLAGSAVQADDSLTLGVTTSTENSGLIGHLIPRFEEATGIAVRTITAGTGQVLRIAKDGEVDVTLTHDSEAELAFVAEGFGLERHEVMHNDFILVGPTDDPAGIAGVADPSEALRRIAEAESVFLSRGDESGTHKAELRVWAEAGIDPTPDSGDWYLESGSGQGASLNIAVGLGAYTLTDRATWSSFGNRGGLRILVEDRSRLVNRYSVMLVNPERHPHVKVEDGLAFIAWITSPEGRAAIVDYHIDGKGLFFTD